jgi:DNA-binding CsgD family transcriptional regulator
MINPFYTFFIEASQQLLNHWIAGSRQVLALVGAGGKRRPTPAVIDPVPGGRVVLSERQGRLLEAVVRRSSAPQRLVRRAQIILLLAAGKTFNQRARALGVLRHTVYKWYNRWRTQARVGRNSVLAYCAVWRSLTYCETSAPLFRCLRGTSSTRV